MKNNWLVILLILITTPLFGQVTVKKGGTVEVNSVEPVGITVFTKDSISLAPISGSFVQIIAGTDTLSGETSSSGSVYFNRNFSEDKPVTIKVSMLGYNSIKTDVTIPYQYSNIDVLMTEKPLEMAEVIITDKNLAIVVKGDTTIYNASAFKTMEGEALSALLKKMPGIEVSNNQVFAGGIKVSKILLNGNAILGNNISDALKFLYSNEVEKVKVYDQFDQNRLVEADTLSGKERVIDIYTKVYKDFVKGAIVSSLGGVVSGKEDNKAVATLGFNKALYTKDKPSLSSTTFGGYNAINDSDISEDPTKIIKSSIVLSNNKPRVSSYSLNIDLDGQQKEKTIVSENTFSEINSSSYSKSDNDNSIFNIRIGGAYSFKINDNNTFLTNTALSLDKNSGSVITSRASTINDLISTYLDDRSDKTHNLGFKTNLTHTYFFNNRKRKLVSYIDFNVNYSSGNSIYIRNDGEQENTLLLNPVRNSAGTNFKVVYTEPLNGVLDLTASYMFTLENGNEKRDATDPITHYQDLTKTYERNTTLIRNTLNTGLSFLTGRKIHGNVSLNYSPISLGVDSRIPETPFKKYTYSHLYPSIDLTARTGPFSLTSTYNEIVEPPQINLLSAVPDFSDPMSVVVGNPNLKLSLRRNVSTKANLNLYSLNTVFSADFTFSQIKNQIINNITFFNTDTFLPEYEYTAPAGSVLVSPINFKSSRTINANIKASIMSDFLKSIITPTLTWSSGENPYNLHGINSINKLTEKGFSVIYQSNFSDKADIVIYYSENFGNNKNEEKNLYGYHSRLLSAEGRIIIIKGLTLNISDYFRYYTTDISLRDEKHNICNVLLGWKPSFAPKLEIRAICNNIFDCKESLSTNRVTFYTNQTITYSFGRSFALKLQYNF